MFWSSRRLDTSPANVPRPCFSKEVLSVRDTESFSDIALQFSIVDQLGRVMGIFAVMVAAGIEIHLVELVAYGKEMMGSAGGADLCDYGA